MAADEGEGTKKLIKNKKVKAIHENIRLMESVIPDLIRNPECFWIPAFAGMTRFVVANKVVYNAIKYCLSGLSFIVFFLQLSLCMPQGIDDVLSGSSFRRDNGGHQRKHCQTTHQYQ
jgi:hypothetical protein